MKYIIAALALALVAFLGGMAFDSNSPSAERFGGVTNFDGVAIGSDGLQQGSTGSVITKMIKGTCDLTGGTVSATSSAFASCAATGVVSGDLVFVSLATSSAAAAIAGAQASTTAGIITVKIFNLSGAAANTTAFGTSTSYWVVR